MRAINGDSGKIPTIVIDSPLGREILIEPTDRDLADRLRQHRGVRHRHCA